MVLHQELHRRSLFPPDLPDDFQQAHVARRFPFDFQDYVARPDARLFGWSVWYRGQYRYSPVSHPNLGSYALEESLDVLRLQIILRRGQKAGVRVVQCLQHPPDRSVAKLLRVQVSAVDVLPFQQSPYLHHALELRRQRLQRLVRRRFLGAGGRASCTADGYQQRRS